MTAIMKQSFRGLIELRKGQAFSLLREQIEEAEDNSDEFKVEELRAQRRALRALFNHPQIDAANTREELVALWLPCLGPLEVDHLPPPDAPTPGRHVDVFSR